MDLFIIYPIYTSFLNEYASWILIVLSVNKNRAPNTVSQVHVSRNFMY